MNEQDAVDQLKAEGFSHAYVWEDGPNATYGDHTHPTLTTHIILKGELTLTSERKTTTHKAGERVDVPANTVHSAKMGSEGCKYVIGK